MTRKGSSKYSDVEIQKWIEFYNRTLSADKTAIEFGVPWGSIYHQLKNRNVIKSIAKGEHLKHSIEAGLEWAKFYSECENARATARHFGVEQSVVRNRLKKRLGVDHCHSTKNIRGLLDAACNTGLGYFRDSPVLLQSAIDYLQKHSPPPPTTQPSLPPF